MKDTRKRYTPEQLRAIATRHLGVYLHQNWCGLDARLVVHPRGLPPGWRETNVTLERVEEARLKAFRLGKTRTVLHLHPETLELIEEFPLV